MIHSWSMVQMRLSLSPSQPRSLSSEQRGLARGDCVNHRLAQPRRRLGVGDGAEDASRSFRDRLERLQAEEPRELADVGRCSRLYRRTGTAWLSLSRTEPSRKTSPRCAQSSTQGAEQALTALLQLLGPKRTSKRRRDVGEEGVGCRHDALSDY